MSKVTKVYTTDIFDKNKQYITTDYYEPESGIEFCTYSTPRFELDHYFPYGWELVKTPDQFEK